MAYDEHLAARVRALLDADEASADTADTVAEIKMFGGWCVTIRGHMAAGVIGDDLIVRVGPDAYEAALARPGTQAAAPSARAMNESVVSVSCR